MLDKQDVKIGLEREKSSKIKYEADTMKAMNEASNIGLANVTQ
jgi:hypothetical protein